MPPTYYSVKSTVTLWHWFARFAQGNLHNRRDTRQHTPPTHAVHYSTQRMSKVMKLVSVAVLKRSGSAVLDATQSGLYGAAWEDRVGVSTVKVP